MSRCGPTPHGFIIWILSPRPLSSRALSAWTLYPIALHMTAEPGSSTKTGGGVLEIPADYIIEDDLWQAKISFHGTHAWSPDSTILVSFYAGFQCLDKEEFTESILESLEEDGFFVRVACLGLADEVHDHPAMIAWHRKCSPSWTGISFYRSRPHHPASGSGNKPLFLHRGFAPPLVCPREHRPVFPYLGMLDGEALPRVGKA